MSRLVHNLRKATPADARALANLAEITFRDTFGHDNTAEDMHLYCRSSFGETLQLNEINDPNLLTLVVDSDGQLTAYGQLRWGSVPPSLHAERPAEICRLYVSQPLHGSGLSRSMMSALLAAARQRDADYVWLGVWERNLRAIRFYMKCGFRTVGEQEFLLGRDRQRDLVMACRLIP